MLAGLQEMSFIPGTNIPKFVPGVAPSYEDVLAGRDMVKYDKTPVKIKDFHAETFDMMIESERKKYEERIRKLITGIQKSECVIWKNELQVLSFNGDQHWMRYLEWAEYDLNEPLLSRKADNASSTADDTVSHKGVLQEIGDSDEQEEV